MRQALDSLVATACKHSWGNLKPKVNVAVRWFSGKAKGGMLQPSDMVQM